MAVGRYEIVSSFPTWACATLLHVVKRAGCVPCNFLSLPLSLGSANFEGFYISISTYSYNPLLLHSWRMNTRARAPIPDLLRAMYGAVDDDAVVPSFFKGFEFRRRPSREYVTTCFDTLISLNSVCRLSSEYPIVAFQCSNSWYERGKRILIFGSKN